MRYKDQRVGLFIDIQNLYHSAKNIYKARVNYKELIKDLVGGRKLIRAIAYVVKSDTALGEGSFFEALEGCGLDLRMKDLQVYPGGMKKADWDVGMAMDAVVLSDKIDVAVLVTGDGDFVPLVDYLRISKGIRVEAMSFGRSTSAKLKEAIDKFYDLDEEPGKFLMK